MSEALLSVRDLRVEFAARRGPLVALDGVSFDIQPGEILGMVGESGAGKSLTGLSIIGLLDPPGRIAGGEIGLDGARIDNLPAAGMRRIRGRRIGIIFQDPLTSLNPLLRIGDQLAETIRAHSSLNPRQARERAIAGLAEVGIPAPEKRIDAYPHEFSGGMRQRVVIALALCAEPALVIADETQRLAAPNGEIQPIYGCQQTARLAVDEARQPGARPIEHTSEVADDHEGIAAHAPSPAPDSYNQHAARRSPIASSGGRSASQRANARGHRGAKAQPLGMAFRRGIAPGIWARRSARESSVGIAAIRPCA